MNTQDFDYKIHRKWKSSLERQVGESILIEHTPLEVIINSKSEWGQGSRIPRITVRREEPDHPHPQDPGDLNSQEGSNNKTKRPSLPENDLQEDKLSSNSKKRPRYQMTDFFGSSNPSRGVIQGEVLSTSTDQGVEKP